MIFINISERIRLYWNTRIYRGDGCYSYRWLPIFVRTPFVCLILERPWTTAEFLWPIFILQTLDFKQFVLWIVKWFYMYNIPNKIRHDTDSLPKIHRSCHDTFLTYTSAVVFKQKRINILWNEWVHFFVINVFTLHRTCIYKPDTQLIHLHHYARD